MLITKEVTVKWRGNTRGWFESKGYVFTKTGDEFIVNVYDLTPQSHVEILASCDVCGKEKVYRLQDYKRMVAGRGSYMCMSCAGHIKMEYKIIKWTTVTSAFDNKGYELVSSQDEYKSNKSYMRFVCSKHRDLGIQKVKYNCLDQSKDNCYSCMCEAKRAEKSHHWQGGKTTLTTYLRDMINPWKLDSMKNCGFLCVLSGEKRNWKIHHLHSFSKIVDETFNELKLDIKPNIGDYTDEEIESISQKILQIHYRYPLGLCIREDLHKLFHSLYGNRSNTPKDFEEFKLRYQAGEFNVVH